MASESHLQRPSEYKFVYSCGKRLDRYLITVFVVPNRLNGHRLGITVSRKVSRKAVNRNRAKRLLREAYRLSSNDLNMLCNKYDWVLNAKREVLTVTMVDVLNEFREIVTCVSIDERVEHE